ncbi:MAG: c-type cytochrome [Planctomycetota bacterium]
MACLRPDLVLNLPFDSFSFAAWRGRWSLRGQVLLLLIAVFSPCVQPHRAVGDDIHPGDDEAAPGLLATYSDGSHQIHRRDRRISFDWKSTPVDTRLQDTVQIQWHGRILVRQPGLHRFHAMIAGEVDVRIDDDTVLNGKGDQILVSGEPVDLQTGDHTFVVMFRNGERKDPKLQLFWSSPDFTLEPLPADVLSSSLLSEESAHSASMRISLAMEQGHRLTDALRCTACHAGLDELPVLPAPSLKHVDAYSAKSLIERLMDPKSVNPQTAMPGFGFSEQDAQDIAAYLRQAATPPSLSSTPKFKDGDADTGAALILKTGCVACHVVAESSEWKPESAYAGPDLSHVSERRSSQWLVTWLKSPETLNPSHRMPVFELSDDERRQIVAALTKDAPTKDAASELKGNAEHGRRLVEAASCRACHEIPGVEPMNRFARPLWTEAASVRSCVVTAEQAIVAPRSEATQPLFVRSSADQTAIRQWLQSIAQPLRPVGHFVKGERLLDRHGCIACHDRDQETGISEIAGMIETLRDDLRGQSQALVPPALTAVGDRLRDESLREILAGRQIERRLPWLAVRMPRFAMSESDQQAIAEYLIGSDRIPDAADEARPELFQHDNPLHPTLATTDELLIGNQLVGAGGFNWIACHKAGAYEPRNVALGTRGSDIMTMGQRIRSRYFLRWMQNPIRVVPGIEMPAIRKSVPGILHDSMQEQFSVMWKALSDARFQPPTVVSRYEQLVNVSPGERPRVIRDVFTLPGTKPNDPKSRRSVARAFAVGFENGHNVLVDLDTMQFRQWSLGEFARQRTEGKSWFWDLAGISITDEAIDLPLAHLEPADTGKALRPVADEQRLGELISWQIGKNDVSLRVRYYYEAKPVVSDAASESASSRHTQRTTWNDADRDFQTAILRLRFRPVGSRSGGSRESAVSESSFGVEITATVEDAPDHAAIVLPAWLVAQHPSNVPWKLVIHDTSSGKSSSVVRLIKGESARMSMLVSVPAPVLLPASLPAPKSQSDVLTSIPGFDGHRLPISTNVMPTAIAWLDDGRLAFTSLRGQVWMASDSDHDGLQDQLNLFAEGLSAPYGIQAEGSSLLVSHKPEVIRLRDEDDDGQADEFDVFATGWGFSDDYHDWTTGLVRDADGRYYVGLGSDYGTQARTKTNDRWRGTILRIDPNGAPYPIAYSFRFPMGLAIDRSGHLFATDNQGVQNTFNEINHVMEGRHYGVPSRFETVKEVAPEGPSLMVPHPWTRSVNAIAFFPEDYPIRELAGHGVGCEYDTRCLIRFTLQDVNGTLQGASYRFSLADQAGGGSNFVGPIAAAFSNDGALYVGSIWDSGWQGGTNTGSIEVLRPSMTQPFPNGIREIRATSNGFDVSFFYPVNASMAGDSSNWSVQGYTRAWGGSYATPDSDRHTLVPHAIEVSDDQKTVSLLVDGLQAGYVFEIAVKKSLDESSDAAFWPREGHYSMKVAPRD